MSCKLSERYGSNTWEKLYRGKLQKLGEAVIVDAAENPEFTAFARSHNNWAIRMLAEAKMKSRGRSLSRRDNVVPSVHVDNDERRKPGIDADEDEGAQIAIIDVTIEQEDIPMEEVRIISQEADGSLQNMDGIVRWNNENPEEMLVPVRRGDRAGPSGKTRGTLFQSGDEPATSTLRARGRSETAQLTKYNLNFEK